MKLKMKSNTQTQNKTVIKASKGVRKSKSGFLLTDHTYLDLEELNLHKSPWAQYFKDDDFNDFG
jgi:hypothetical protein